MYIFLNILLYLLDESKTLIEENETNLGSYL